MTPSVQPALIALQAVQVAFLLLHDYVPLGRLSNREAARGIDSPARLFWTTVLSALPFLAVFAVCCVYGRAPWPGWLHVWLWYSYLVLLAGALMAWWIPYLVHPDPERAARYKVRFAGTIKFLPEHNGITPDTLHVLFHCWIVATLVLLKVR